MDIKKLILTLMIGMFLISFASAGWVELDSVSMPESEYPVISSLNETRLAVSYLNQTSGRQNLETYDWNGTNLNKVGNKLNINGAGNMQGLTAISDNEIVYLNGNRAIAKYSFNGTDWNEGIYEGIFGSGWLFPVVSKYNETTVAVTDGNNFQLISFNSTDFFQTKSNTFTSFTNTGVSVFDTDKIALLDTTDGEYGSTIQTYDVVATGLQQVGNDYYTYCDDGIIPSLTTYPNDRVGFRCLFESGFDIMEFDGTDWNSLYYYGDTGGEGFGSISAMTNYLTAFFNDYDQELQIILGDEIDPTISITGGNDTRDYAELWDYHTINYTISDDNLEDIWIKYGDFSDYGNFMTRADKIIYDRDADVGSTEHEVDIPDWCKEGDDYSNITISSHYSAMLMQRYIDYNCTNSSGMFVLDSKQIPNSVSIDFTLTFTGQWNANETYATFPLQAGVYDAIIYANDTVGNKGIEIITWNYKIMEKSRDYSLTTPEGNTDEFSVNVVWDNINYNNINAYLNYNGTRQSIASKTSSGNEVNFSYDMPIPVVDADTNFTFYWEFLVDGEYINSTQSNQTVENIELAECGVGYEDIVVNLSLFDENLNEYINVSDTSSNIEIDLSLSSLGGSLIDSYSNQWTDNNNVSVCLPTGTINNSVYTIDFVIKYNTDDHVTEYFYLDNGTLTSDLELTTLTDKNINLMDLLTTDSTSFLFNYFDSDGLVVDDIIVHVFRKYVGEGVFREVERAKQNDNGDTVIHLIEEDAIYYFSITKYGQMLFTSNTYTALCQTTPCTIRIQGSNDFEDFDDNWDLIENGAYTLNSNSLTREVNLTYELITPSAMNLTVYKLESDGSYSVIGTEEETGTSGSLIVTVPVVSGNTSFFASVYQDDQFIKSQWIDFEEDAGLYFGNTLSLFLGALIILTLGLMAVAEGSATIIFLLIGMFIAMALGLVDYRTSTGLSIFIYFVIAGGIIVWKLTRRNR